jgi:UDP-N-acetylmuramoyl-tripeptide--D-alanyl-D-alanine ligase
MRLRASEISAAVGGRLEGENVIVDGAAFDSRSLKPGQLFVPVVAERDGHDFVAGAITDGASAYFTSRGRLHSTATAIHVTDTAQALLSFGRHARTRLPDRVIGVTGSVGKTSVKDLIAAICTTHFVTQANEKSFNNELGLPQTLCNAPDGCEAVVVEMGMRGFGEIALLCEIAKPTIGVITVIGEAHTGRVGGIDGVARAKGELVESLPEWGTAVLNADQPICVGLKQRTEAKVLGFGLSSGDVRAENMSLDRLARPSFRLVTPWGSADVSLLVSGAHMAVNAAAAAAASLAAGVPLDKVVAGLGAARLSPWRMEMTERADGLIVINDAYNANPTSMLAALDALASLPVAGRRVAVLGPMAELDEDGPERHRAMLTHARSKGIAVIAVGTDDYGVEPVVDLERELATLTGDDAVLVKGSRVAGLERVAERLTGR